MCVIPYASLLQTDSSGFPLQLGWGWKLPDCACNNTQHLISASVKEGGEELKELTQNLAVYTVTTPIYFKASLT